MKRQFDPACPELMDRPQPASAELAADLANLRQLNRYFGSYRLIRFFMRRWISPGARLRVADLATGSGDIPRLLVRYARTRGAEMSIDAVDYQPGTIEIARQLSKTFPEIRYHCANILEFGQPATYDIVCCSLALHHFSQKDAVGVLRRCAELSRRFVLVADLRRGILATMGVYLLTALIFRDPMTKQDGRTSVRRAFSFAELRDLACRAGWSRFKHRRFRFARQAIWLEPANIET
jgi:2-polyprenyl-3-methyl-5-hydroxy-6-metoxy-1,4-benzoquinol methylase